MYSPGYPPVAPVPARSPALGDRGPWWVQALISAGIGVVFFVLSVALQYVLIQVDVDEWPNLAAWSVLGLIFVGVLALWGRTTTRRIVGALVALVLIGVHRILQVFWVVSEDNFLDWADWQFKALWWTGTVVLYSGVILGWTIARRRTGFTWIGLLPVAILIALAVWANWELPYIDSDFRRALAGNAIDYAFWIVGILIFWGCDGFGLASQRNASPPPSSPFGGVGGHGQGYGTQGYGTQWPGQAGPTPPAQGQGWPPPQQSWPPQS
ncbi:hypothetical protein ACWDPV_22230 [Gordonia sp. NPDC003504]